ncbi:MAG: OadG family protein [Bacilli bacterium]|nr:OadG family protein [Bacilli bacterium]
MFLGIWTDWENIGVGEALLIALIAITIVFLVLGIIIFISFLFQKGIEIVQKKTEIMPRKENEILNSDEDAVVAVLTATIEFHKETGKDARVISIKRIED